MNNVIASPERSAWALSNATARALVQAIMDADILGVALLRGARRVHVMANAKYAILVGVGNVIGRAIGNILPTMPAVVLEGVDESGGTAFAREVRCGGPGALEDAHHATFTFQSVFGEPGSLLVLAQDVTDVVRARERGKLFVTLAGELLSTLHPRAAIRSAVEQTQTALGAKTSSLFVLAEDGRTLTGAKGEWDWTRASFEMSLDAWPTMGASLASGRVRYLTEAEARGGERGWFEANGTVGALCVPLRWDDRPLGVLFFDFDVESPPPMASVDFAESVGVHCAAALSRALASEDTLLRVC